MINNLCHIICSKISTAYIALGCALRDVMMNKKNNKN